MGIPPRRAVQDCRALAYADTDSPLRITIYDSYANVKPLSAQALALCALRKKADNFFQWYGSKTIGVHADVVAPQAFFALPKVVVGMVVLMPVQMVCAMALAIPFHKGIVTEHEDILSNRQLMIILDPFQ